MKSWLISVSVKRAGRLVHDQQLGVERQRLGDLDHLLLRDAQSGHRPLRIERQMQLVQERLRPAAHLLPVDQLQGAVAEGLAADPHVLGDAQLRHQVELLVDDADAEVLGGSGVDG